MTAIASLFDLQIGFNKNSTFSNKFQEIFGGFVKFLQTNSLIFGLKLICGSKFQSPAIAEKPAKKMKNVADLKKFLLRFENIQEKIENSERKLNEKKNRKQKKNLKENKSKEN